MQKDLKEKPQYAIVAAVHLPGVSDEGFAASLTELAKTLGFKVTRTFVQKCAGFDSTAYLGGGKRQEIRRFVHGDADDETASDDASRLSAQTDDAETCLKLVSARVEPSSQALHGSYRCLQRMGC